MAYEGRMPTLTELLTKQAFGAGGLALDMDEPPEEMRGAPPVVTQAPMDVRPGGPLSRGDFDSQPSHLTLDQNGRMPDHEGAAGADEDGEPFPSPGASGAGRTYEEGSLEALVLSGNDEDLDLALEDAATISKREFARLPGQVQQALIRGWETRLQDIARECEESATQLEAAAQQLESAPYERMQYRTHEGMTDEDYAYLKAQSDTATIVQQALDGDLYQIQRALDRGQTILWQHIPPEVRGPLAEDLLAQAAWKREEGPLEYGADFRNALTQFRGRTAAYDDEGEDAAVGQALAGKKPWQLPFREYIRSIGGEKSHSNDAYEKYRAEPFFDRPSTVIDTQPLPDGRAVEFRRSDESVNYTGGTVGREKTLYAVLDGWIIGKVTDEWGATLVQVDPDYRGAGIGSRLTAHARREWPERGSGGMTPQGYRMNKQVHKMLVQDALARGEDVPPEVLTEYPDLEPAAMPDQVPAEGDPQKWEAPMWIHTPGMKPVEEMESWEKYDAENWPRIDPERHHEYGHPLQGLFESMGKPLELGKTEHPKRPSYWYRWPKGQPTYQEAHDFFKKHDIQPDKYNQYSWYAPQVEPGFPQRPAPLKKESEFGADLRMLDQGEGGTALDDWDDAYSSVGDQSSGEGGGSTIHLGQVEQVGPAGPVEQGGRDVGAAVAERVGGQVPLERGVYPVGGNILKITDEAAEANAMHVVYTNPSSLMVRVYDVFGFKVAGQVRYGILQEKLDPPDPAYAMLCDGFAGQPITEDHVSATIQAWEGGETPYSVDVRQLPPDWKAWILGVARYFDQVGIRFEDLHGQNVMRKGPKHKVIDLGFSQAPQQSIEIIARRRAMPMKKTRGGLVMEVSGTGGRVQFNLYDYRYRVKEYPDEPKPLGIVSIGETPDPNVYMVRRADAYVSGYGPLMYDAALEWVAREGKWLCADRRSVSGDAGAVWLKYMSRPDVEKTPVPEELKAPTMHRLNPEQTEAINFMYRKPDDKTLRFFERAYERQFGHKPYYLLEQEGGTALQDVLDSEYGPADPLPSAAPAPEQGGGGGGGQVDLALAQAIANRVPPGEDPAAYMPAGQGGNVALVEEVRKLMRAASYRTAQNQGRAPWLAVDLDGTLLQYEQGMAGQKQFGKPMQGAAKAMRELKSLGWKVSVFTARIGDGGPEETQAVANQIAEVLDGYGIPYDDVWIGRKPKADFFVDDKAIPFRGSWDEVLRELVEVGQSGKGDGQDWHVDDVAGQAADVAMGHDGTTGLIDPVDGPDEFNDQGYTRHDISVSRPPDRRMWF